jgi:hypothetical protein
MLYEVLSLGRAVTDLTDDILDPEKFRFGGRSAILREHFH